MENVEYLIYGLRKKMGITQRELASKIGDSRRNIGRYEQGERSINSEKLSKLIRFIKLNGLKVNDLEPLGRKYYSEVEKRENSVAMEIPFSEDLAELIGIILGDGCVQKDGTVIIAFHKIDDLKFIKDRVCFLIKKLVSVETFFYFDELTNRACVNFYSKPFVKFLKLKCQIKPGNKIKNQSTIPAWCFRNNKWLRRVARGLFDTDGNFYVEINSPVIDYRF